MADVLELAAQLERALDDLVLREKQSLEAELQRQQAAWKQKVDCLLDRRMC